MHSGCMNVKKPNIDHLYRRGAHELGELFCWCVQNLQKFPPMKGHWIEEVKRRLLEKDTPMPADQRCDMWYVVDRAHDNAVLRGPYKYAETAAAVRAEMEMSWDDGDKFHPRPDTRNLCIVLKEKADAE